MAMLVASKTRIAPINTINCPYRTVQLFRNQNLRIWPKVITKYAYEAFLWTDSKVGLKWIMKTSAKGDDYFIFNFTSWLNKITYLTFPRKFGIIFMENTTQQITQLKMYMFIC